MSAIVRSLKFNHTDAAESDRMVTREWLVTNGIGGFASGSIAGVPTRRYHGYLISSLPTPLGRTVMLNYLSELVRLPNGARYVIGGFERKDGSLELPSARALKEFRLEQGLPVWRYELEEAVIEKRVLMPHMQNTVHVTYRLLQGDGRVRLKVRPALQFRALKDDVSKVTKEQFTILAIEDRLEVKIHRYPPLRLKVFGLRATFTLDALKMKDIFYRIEARRGYDHTGELWCPGYFSIDLTKDKDATVVASTEGWDMINALLPEEAQAAETERRAHVVGSAHPLAREGIAAEMVLAADQFIITPAGRQDEEARAHAAGEEVRSIIAGYHWFTDWGRDTMISLEGLGCTTGRFQEAGWILRTFGHYVRKGLIPNMFPDGSHEGVYHTADATLWFFHAMDRYLQLSHDRDTLQHLLPKFRNIVENHLRGTSFGIKVDEKDGLLRQGAKGYQLTWMDAKCNGWVVTPRRGKAVEINALWYNALRLLEEWENQEGDKDATKLHADADVAYESFNTRFWCQDGGYLYDVVDAEDGGDDAAFRPNQLFAISLKYPVLERSRWESVLNAVHEKLLTPLGLRSLSTDHPDYKSRYDGDLRRRDAAYHQGTVWGWLIGPFIDAWLKVHPNDRNGARVFLEGFIPHLNEAGVGSISEIFDAEEPYSPRGCIAQAWSVAEFLRCWVETSKSEK